MLVFVFYGKNGSREKLFGGDRSFSDGKVSNFASRVFFFLWDSFEGFFFRTHHISSDARKWKCTQLFIAAHDIAANDNMKLPS